MWNYEKRLQYPVNIKTPNAKLDVELLARQFAEPVVFRAVFNLPL